MSLLSLAYYFIQITHDNREMSEQNHEQNDEISKSLIEESEMCKLTVCKFIIVFSALTCITLSIVVLAMTYFPLGKFRL